ncbi:MAG TPA: type IV secretion system protein [Steroidobacteraceae bacterium]|nr:type IV secretion system protein [Steroidobacteraceae bacterium]
MGFFETFWSWLNEQLAKYIGDNTAHVSTAMEPAIVTLATLYVMIWGYLQLTGRIEEPFIVGLKRILTLAVVLGVALHLWLYNTVIVDTFYSAPAELAAAVIGATDPVHTIDSIWEQGGAVAGYLFNNGGIFHGDIGFFIAGIVVWVIMGLLCVYTMFLIALSHVALSILLALGPFFIAMLLFERTQRLFEAWLAQLTNYALITLLTIMVAALLLQVVNNYAIQTAARGTALVTVDALNMVLVAVLVFLFMRQVMPIASSLASGAALNTMGTVSRTVNWGARAGFGAMQLGARTAVALLTRGRG